MAEPQGLEAELATQLASAKLKYEGTAPSSLASACWLCEFYQHGQLCAEAMYKVKAEMQEINDERRQLTEDNELLYEQVQLLQRQSNDLNWQVRAAGRC